MRTTPLRFLEPARCIASDLVRAAMRLLLKEWVDAVNVLHARRHQCTSCLGPVLRGWLRHLCSAIEWHDSCFVYSRQTIPFLHAMNMARHVYIRLKHATIRLPDGVCHMTKETAAMFNAYLDGCVHDDIEWRSLFLSVDEMKLGMLLRAVSVEERCVLLRYAGYPDVVIDVVLLPTVNLFERHEMASLARICAHAHATP